MGQGEKSELRKATLQVGSVVAFYFVVSLSMTMANKLLLDRFKFPLFTTWYQLVWAMIGVVVGAKLRTSIPFLSFFPPLQFDLNVAKKVLPLSVVYVGMICFTNMSMTDVSLTFYQILRAMVIPINVIISFTMLKISTSPKALLACGGIVTGFILGSLGEIRFTWYGFITGCLSSLFVALNSAMVKRVLPAVNQDSWVLLQYNTAIAIALLFLPMLWMEPPSVWIQNEMVSTGSFWAGMTVAAALGLLINLAYFLQIKYCSPLTSHVSGNAKSTVQSLLSLFLFDGSMSLMGVIGLILTLGGSIAYSQIKYMEMKTGIKVHNKEGKR